MFAIPLLETECPPAYSKILISTLEKKLEIGMLTPDMTVKLIYNQPNRQLKEFLDKLEETMHLAGRTLT